MANQTGQPTASLPISAGLILAVLCLLWGGNAVSIRISNEGVPPLLAALIRSIVSGALVWGYARLKGHRVAFPKGTQIHALMVGLLFGVEFLFFYWGLAYTPASRSGIFFFTQPFWVALGAHFFIPGDRLTSTKLIGLGLAFCGVLVVFGERPGELPPLFWLGDLMVLAAAVFWAAVTLYVKRIALDIELSHHQTLFAQLAFAIPVFALGSILFETPFELNLTPLVINALLYQSVIVAFASYLVWFWLIHHYSVSRLTSFTFMSPLFGVILGGALLGEPVTLLIWVGLACVGAGIYVVNR